MRRMILTLLVVTGLSGMAFTGCVGVPAEMVQSIADIDSNSRANNDVFRRVLDGYTPTVEEKAHCKARTIALDDLTPKTVKWAQDHQKE